MITALIRLETRNAAEPDQKRFERLAGRVDALAILYQALSNDEQKDEVDLGIYLSQIASAVMASHAVEGIRLDMKVDTYRVSINVAMPTGLVVNELLTNALKHGFKGREGGTITLHSVVDGDGCRITIADDGVVPSQPQALLPTGRRLAFVDALRCKAYCTARDAKGPKGASAG